MDKNRLGQFDSESNHIVLLNMLLWFFLNIILYNFHLEQVYNVFLGINNDEYFDEINIIISGHYHFRQHTSIVLHMI